MLPRTIVLLACLWPASASALPLEWPNGGDLVVLDHDASAVVYERSAAVPIDPEVPLTLRLTVRTGVSGQRFVAALVFEDAGGTWLRGRNLDIEGRGEVTPRPYEVTFRTLPAEAAAARVLLSATPFEDALRGDAWFSDVSLVPGEPLAGVGGARLAAPDGVAAWVAPAAMQVLPGAEPPLGAPDGAIDLAGLRGEAEVAQIALRGARTVTAVEPSALVGPSGAIPASAIEVREVVLVNVPAPSDPTGLRGWLPDPLPPLELPWHPGRETRAMWVTVWIPVDAAAGEYEGAIRVVLDAGTVRVPVRLRVFGATLPRTPALRTAFDVPAGAVARAHHQEGDRSGLRETMGLYYRDMARHRISAMDPMQGAAIDAIVPAWAWTGGRVVPGAHGSARALRVSAGTRGPEADIRTVAPIHVRPGRTCGVSWTARAATSGGRLRLEVQARDGAGRALDTIASEQPVGVAWTPGRMTVGPRWLPAAARGLRLRMVAAAGAIAVDDVDVTCEGAAGHLLGNVGFEAPLDDLRIELDTAAFDAAGAFALDELGMTGFRLWVDGLPYGVAGTSVPGALLGFPAGTPEYATLATAIVGRVEQHLQQRGWLDAAWLYPYDEPRPGQLAQVATALDLIRRVAPGLPRLVTTAPAKPLLGVVDLWAPVLTEVTDAAVTARHEAKEAVWTYVSCCLQWPAPNLLIDRPAMEARMLPLTVRALGLDGLLYWSIAAWGASDPWSDTMTVLQDGFAAGHGDGRLVYPPRNMRGPTVAGPVPTMRWELLREGLEDVDRLALLERAVAARMARGDADPAVARARALLGVPSAIVAGRSYWTRDPDALERWRRSVGVALEQVAAPLGSGWEDEPAVPPTTAASDPTPRRGGGG